MSPALALLKDQDAIWNGPAAQAWIDMQPTLDAMFEPFEQMLVDAVRAHGANHVLDLGCGTGATTVALQRALDRGRCVGVDISRPMLAVARRRAAEQQLPAEFLVHDFEEAPLDGRTFDMAVSRFGAMFFTDPVRAFRNIESNLSDGGRMRLVAWRSPAENPFMTTAERAAAEILPDFPRRPDGPGQFAFADPARVRAILVQSGWAEPAIEPIDVPCAFPAARLPDYVSRLGPLGQVLGQMEEPDRSDLVARVCEAFAPFRSGAEIRFNAACWLVDATVRRD